MNEVGGIAEHEVSAAAAPGHYAGSMNEIELVEQQELHKQMEELIFEKVGSENQEGECVVAALVTGWGQAAFTMVRHDRQSG